MRQLHDTFEKGLNLCFPLRTRKKKSIEPVWMTDEIRELIRKWRRLYRRVRRKGKWLELKALTTYKIVERKKDHAKYVADMFVTQKDTP